MHPDRRQPLAIHPSVRYHFPVGATMEAGVLPWLKAGHFLGILLWAGGLLALSRLLATHQAQRVEGAAGAQLAQVEARLYRTVALPGAFLALLTGIAMLHANTALLRQPYMHAKLTAVVLLFGADHACLRGAKALSAGRGLGGRTYTLIHAVVGALLIAAVLFITVRPWAR